MKRGIFVGLLILTCAITGCSKVTPISKEITMELGQALSDDPAQFVNVSDEEILSEISMDFSEINFEKAGDYTANALHGEKQYPIVIHILDTTPPEAELIASCVISTLNTDVRAEDLFTGIEDKAETSVGIVSIQRIGDLEEMSDEELAAIEMPNAMHEPLTETDFLETMQFTEEGKYLVKAAVKDESANVTWFEIPIFADGTSPVISGADDIQIEISTLKTEPDYDLSHVKVIDAFDGDITDSDRVYFEETELEIKESVATSNGRIIAFDRAGNQSEASFEIKTTVDMQMILEEMGLITTTAVPETKAPYFDRSMAEQEFALVNEQRTSHGVAPLAWDESMYELACVRAQEVSQNFSHTRPDGTDVTVYGYGENIATNYKSLTNLINAWMNSQGHKENILDARYSAGTIGCYYYNGSYHWVNLFRP